MNTFCIDGSAQRGVQSGTIAIALTRTCPLGHPIPTISVSRCTEKQLSTRGSEDGQKNKRGAPSFLTKIALHPTKHHTTPLIKFICCAPRTSLWTAYLLDNHFIAHKLLEYTGRHAFRQLAVQLTANLCPRTSVWFV